jgi:hypothetical protein
MYKILEKKIGSNEWNPEKFYTGGWPFKTSERAIALKNKLCKMSNSEFKIQRV